MREFKFRAWDKADNKMYYDAEKTYDFIGNDIMEESFGSLLHNDNYIVMQYTGLIDTNNKEIYEGDIVERLDLTPTKNYYGKVDVGVVEYKTSRYILKRKDDHYFDMSYDNIFSISQYKVLGNIYETPDLLK